MDRLLSSLRDRQCRFPVGGEGETTQFCAAEVTAERWYRGQSGDRYCSEHRARCVSRRQDQDDRAFLTWQQPARARLAGAA